MAPRHWFVSISASSLVVAVTLVSLLRIPPARASEHKYKTISNDQALEMLKLIETDIKANYYDPTFHSFDLDKRFEQARREIMAAKSQDEAFLDIAGAVVALKDSHTRFIPPARPYGVDYGWSMQAIGDAKCYVAAVRLGSDAASKGLRPGDQVVSVNGVKVLRQDIKYLTYSFRVFPQSGLHLEVQSPDGSKRALVAMAKVIPGQEIVRHSDVLEWMRHNHGPADRSRYYRPNKQVLFWKLPDFLLSPEDAEHLVAKEHSYDTIVLDLRGNPGGLSDALDKFIGAFFDHDIKIGDRKARNEMQPKMAKGRGGKAFAGKLIVLVDSESQSASEIFARVVQLEKRGIVLGDRSAGAVMESKPFIHAVNLDATNVAQYNTSITIADVIMFDGKSLENVGVTPDERILPTPADLAAGHDPVLARAAEIAGIEMTPEEAGKIFPFDWPKEEMPVIGKVRTLRPHVSSASKRDSSSKTRIVDVIRPSRVIDHWSTCAIDVSAIDL